MERKEGGKQARKGRREEGREDNEGRTKGMETVSAGSDEASGGMGRQQKQ